jgi:Mitochondrial inner membrane protein
MPSDYSYSNSAPKSGGTIKRILIITTLAFLIGIGLMWWAVTRWTPARDLVLGQPQTEPAIPVAPALGTANLPPAIRTPAPTIAANPLEDRIEALESRVSGIGGGGSGGAASSRAEGLLIAFAARRAIDRGLALGYIEAALQQQFGGSQPRAVGIIIATARQPVTLDALKDGLTEVGPQLINAGPDKGWGERIQDSLSSLIIIRKAGAPSANPVDRLARAQRMIDAGRVDTALAEVARLPGAAAGANWMKDARRLVEAHRALDVLEAAAIMQPGKSEAPKTLPPISEPKQTPRPQVPSVDDTLL